MRERPHRLPDGTITYDENLWAQSWSDFADEVVKFFPGFHVSGMDPGVILHGPGPRDTVSLSTDACHALLSTRKHEQT